MCFWRFSQLTIRLIQNGSFLVSILWIEVGMLSPKHVLRSPFLSKLSIFRSVSVLDTFWPKCILIFRDDFSPKFVALFTLLLFLKSFHWLSEDRVDFMERSPSISALFHIRVISLAVLLGFLDINFIIHAYQSTLTKGASVQLVFGKYWTWYIIFCLIKNPHELLIFF